MLKSTMMKLLFTALILLIPNIVLAQTEQENISIAEKLFTDGEYSEAVVYYDKVIIVNPELTEAYIKRGYSKYKLDNFKGAVDDYNAALELEPNIANVYYWRAQAKSKLPNSILDANSHKQPYDIHRRTKEAIKDYDTAIKLDPNIAIFYRDRGAAKSKMYEYQSAIEDYTKAIELDPKYTQAYISRGMAKNSLKEYKAALDDYNKALELSPSAYNIYFLRGNTKSQMGNNTSAILDYNRAIKIEPKYYIAYHDRAVSKSKLKDYRGAIQDFNIVIDNSADSRINLMIPLSYHHRGVSKYMLKDYRGAIVDINKALELKAIFYSADPYLLRGSANEQLGKYKAAMEDYNTAIEKYPDSAEAYEIRGLLKINRGQLDSGCLDLSKAGELGLSTAYDSIQDYCQ